MLVAREHGVAARRCRTRSREGDDHASATARRSTSKSSSTSSRPSRRRAACPIWDELGRRHVHRPLAPVQVVRARRATTCTRWSRTKFELRPGHKYIISVGSVGQPRDYDNRASYTIYDTDEQRVRVQARRVRHRQRRAEDLRRRARAQLRQPPVPRRVKRIWVAAAAMAAFGIAACAQLPRLRAQDGVIVDANSPYQCGHRGRLRSLSSLTCVVSKRDCPPPLQPPQNRIRILRRVLEHLATDKRYYFYDGQYVLVSAWCAELVVAGDPCPPGVHDPGACEWEIRFDVEHGTFDHFLSATTRKRVVSGDAGRRR